MKLTPLPYQEKSIEQIDEFKGRALLAHDMGLGKTLISLWWWLEHPDLRPGLVVCPASIKYVWEAEAASLGVSTHVIEGRSPAETNGADLVIVNYDVLAWHVDDLKQTGFKTLFVDECQAIKNPGTERSRATREMARSVKKVLALSGTPLMNRPDELFNVVQMVKPSVFPTRKDFELNYCKRKWTPWGDDLSEGKHLPQLHKLLRGTCMIRYTKAGVLPELPSKIRRVLPVGMRNEDEYLSARDDFLEWMAKRNPKKLKSAERAESLVRLGYLKRLAAKLKCRKVVEWVNRWLEEYPGEKLILFAVHQGMIRVLREHVEAKSVLIDGSVKGRDRKAAVDRFQTDEGARVLIGSKAAWAGLTLTAASTAAFAELDFVPTNHTQAEDRIHRIGQTKQSWIWYLVAAGSIEEHLCKILQEKQGVVESVLDGGKVNGLDVYTQLMAREGLMR